MIKRNTYLQQLQTALRRSPITALLGPRQCGKTTLARQITAAQPSHFFDLESFQDQARLQNPEFILSALEGLIVIDEIQRLPALFNVLRVMADQPQPGRRFLILGSASPDIVKNVSETLAGRVEFVDLSGFNVQETGPVAMLSLWMRGGFPRSFLSVAEADSRAWRESFIRTFLERDIPQLGISIPPQAMHRFWTMLAHYHGQTWNASELARSMGLSDKTIRSYLDILSGTYMVRQLQPWHENLAKRQVKAPKVYLRDSGLLHTLLALPDMHTLTAHPKVGASWEGFVLEQVIQVMHLKNVYFWSTYQGAEIDLFFIHNGKRYGIEVKYSTSPRLTRSTRIALQDLALEHVWIIYPGQHAYPLEAQISVLPLQDLHTLKEMFGPNR